MSAGAHDHGLAARALTRQTRQHLAAAKAAEEAARSAAEAAALSAQQTPATASGHPGHITSHDQGTAQPVSDTGTDVGEDRSR